MAQSKLHLSSGIKHFQVDAESIDTIDTSAHILSEETLPTTSGESQGSSNSNSSNSSVTEEPCGNADDDDTASVCSWTTAHGEVGLSKESANTHAPFVASPMLYQDMPTHTAQMPSNMVLVPVAIPLGWSGPSVVAAGQLAPTPRQQVNIHEESHFFACQPGMYASAIDDKSRWQVAGVAASAGSFHSPRAGFHADIEIAISEVASSSAGPNSARKRAQKNQNKSTAPTPAAQRGGVRRSHGADLEDAFTTVIMRNLPPDVSRDLLAKLLNMAGLANAYDFVHLPVELKSEKSLGYALINMTTHRNALRVIAIFQGFDAWPVAGVHKPCELGKSTPMQGLAAHVNRYRNSPLMHACVPEEFKPAMYRSGVKVNFPPPTQRLRMPRVRYQKLAAAAYASSNTGSSSM